MHQLLFKVIQQSSEMLSYNVYTFGIWREREWDMRFSLHTWTYIANSNQLFETSKHNKHNFVFIVWCYCCWAFHFELKICGEQKWKKWQITRSDREMNSYLSINFKYLPLISPDVTEQINYGKKCTTFFSLHRNDITFYYCIARVRCHHRVWAFIKHCYYFLLLLLWFLSSFFKFFAYSLWPKFQPDNVE